MLDHRPATLVSFAGLPGTGKTTLARLLAQQLQATYLRIDTIEQALRDSRGSAAPVYEAGYLVAYALAADNLRLGNSVVADSVNPLQITRDAWRGVAEKSGAKLVEIEVVCSDAAEHRRRVESRMTDIPGLPRVLWQDVEQREYTPWNRSHVIVDTAHRSIDQVLAGLGAMVAKCLDG